MQGAMVSTMQTTKNNSVLYTGDSFGFINVWNMDGYCAEGCAEGPPECKSFYIYTHSVFTNGYIVIKVFS